MPIKCKKGKPRYRVKTTKSGKRVRLAFCGNKVIEAKKLKKGGERKCLKKKSKT